MKKWREFLDGGNGIWVFSKKGKHPPPAKGRKECRPEGEPAGRNAILKEGSDHEWAHDKNSKSPNRHIYFPLEIISIVRHRPIEISVQK